MASSKANILNDIFGDLDNDTLAANLISSKIKPKSGNARPKFKSSSFQKPRTIQPTIPASKVKPVPDIISIADKTNAGNQQSTNDSRINDSNDFSDEFDDDFAFTTPATIRNIDFEKSERIEDTDKQEHRVLSTQKMNLVEKYSKYTNKQETKAKEPEIQKPQEIIEKSDHNDSINSIDSDPPSPIITQSKHRIEISSESENDASQERINPTSFIVKQEPIDTQDGATEKSVTTSSGCFSTASGSSVKISEEAKVKVAQSWNSKPDTTGNLFNANKQPAGSAPSGFFSTARGGHVNISANALAQSKSLFETSSDTITPMDSSGSKRKLANNLSPLSPGSSKSFFSTGLGKGYKISEESISKSKSLFDSNKQSAGSASTGFFSTGRGGQVHIDSNALAKSKGLFSDSADFTTPNKSSKASSGGFFATAKGGNVNIGADALAKSKDLFQCSEAKLQTKTLAGAKSTPSASTPARPVRPYAGSLNLKRKTAFPEQIGELEETKKGRIEAEQECIKLALRNSYPPFQNFKIDENDRPRTHQNQHEKDILDLIMPRPHFDKEEKASINEKLFQPILRPSNQNESFQEQN